MTYSCSTLSGSVQLSVVSCCLPSSGEYSTEYGQYFQYFHYPSQYIQIAGEYFQYIQYSPYTNADTVLPRSSLPGPLLSLASLQRALPEQQAGPVLRVLEAMGLCSKILTEGEQEWEFPCFGEQKLPEDWEPGLLGPGEWGGVLLSTAEVCAGPLLAPMFPRVQVDQVASPVLLLAQVQLQRSVTSRLLGECSLQQWQGCSTLECGALRATVRLQGEQVAVVVRAPEGDGKTGFFFLEEILGIIDQVLVEMSPGLPMDKHVVSPADLARGSTTPTSWAPKEAMTALHTGGWQQVVGGGKETLLELLCFGSQEVGELLVPGPELHVSSMSTVTRQTLCQLLDPAHPLGKDWCLLAVQMGLIDKVRQRRGRAHLPSPGAQA